MNEHDDTCRFLQVWLSPHKGGLKPQYGSQTHDKSDRHNTLLHLLGGIGSLPAWADIGKPSSVVLQQDANVFVSEADAGVKFDVPLEKGRQAYVVCIEGSMVVGEEKLKMRDACEVFAGKEVVPMSIAAGENGAHFMLIEMQAE